MNYSEKISELLEKGILVTPEALNELETRSKKQEEESNEKTSNIKVLFNYTQPSKKRSVNDFVSYFNIRFKTIEKMLRQRPELEGLISINKLKLKSDRENISLIGMIISKSTTKNKHIILELEDLSGKTKVLINVNNTTIYEIAKDLVLDETIGVVGVSGKDIVFANNILFPDIPMTKELKKAPKEEYAVFVGDSHIGSNLFLKKEFEKFISWIRGQLGNEAQKEMARKTKYVFFAGDLVEGVGIYPDQEKDLTIKDIKKQYSVVADYLRKIPIDKKIILCPGNHDAGRIADPQPAIYNDFAEDVCNLPNAIIVSSPSITSIGCTESFEGLKVLMYHGYSLIYYADNVESIRNQGGQKRADLIMKFLLQRRHMAPTHESNLYVPDAESDPMVIDIIPDIFITGHIHRASISNYKNITLINTSCWSDKSEDQEKRGLEPLPGRVFVTNLQTRETKQINFFRD